MDCRHHRRCYHYGRRFVGGRIRDARALTEFQTGEKVVAFSLISRRQRQPADALCLQRDATLGWRPVVVLRMYIGRGRRWCSKGDILVQLETAALQRSVDTAAQNLVIAEAALENCSMGRRRLTLPQRKRRGQQCTGSSRQCNEWRDTATIAASEANVRAAQANLNAAYANYQSATEGRLTLTDLGRIQSASCR